MRALLLLLGLATTLPASAASGADALSRAVEDVAAKATPAVVHIETEKSRTTSPDLQELWAVYGLPLGAPVWSRTIEREATGSGAIVTPSGLVYTNHHVVESAVRVTVVLADKRRLPAHVVGSDARTDIAVVQIDEKGPFPTIPLADSDDVRVGEVVCAIGSPFDFQSSVSVGVVSAMGRRGLSPREIQDYIQTDAAVNPGNSGGPLLDGDGRMVGINTAIYAPNAEQNSGISFAIPSNMVRRVAARIQQHGRVPRSWIGVATSTVQAVESDPTRGGGEVERVLPGSPAERAGIRRGDVVVAVDGQAVPSTKALRAYVLSRDVGARVTVTVEREGRRRDLPVVTDEEHAIGTALPEVPDDAWPWAGMAIVDGGDALLSSLGVPMGRGVLVARVEPDSPAAEMGLTAGDRIVDIGGVAVSDEAQLRQLLADRKHRWEVVGWERAGTQGVAILPTPGNESP